MVDICLPSPNHWSNKQQQKQQQQSSSPEQKPTYKMANGEPQQEEEQPTPVASSSNGSSRYNVDSLGSGTSTKSCFSLFSSRSNKHNAYSKSNSSQSSSQPLRPPSVHNNNKTTEQEELAKTWEAFHQNQFSSQDEQDTPTNNNNNVASRNAQASELWQFDSEEALNLLQPPKPTDRSHKQRLKLEQAKRQSGVYDGELEPEGVRGQEAMVIAGGGSAQTSTPMRQFDPQYQKPQRQGFHSTAAAKALAAGGRISPNQNPAQPPLQQQQSQQLLSIRQTHSGGRPLETIAELSESRMSASDTTHSDVNSWSSQQAHSRPLSNTPPRNRRRYNQSPRTVSPGSSSISRTTPHSPARSVDPPGNNHSFESNSTDSDEDISRMMSDFLYSNNNTTNASLNSSLLEREYPNPIHMPKSDWSPPPQHQQQQQQRPIPITVSESSNSSSQSSTSPYRLQQHNKIHNRRISPDSATRGIAPMEEEGHSIPLRHASQGQDEILPPPQNQHSPQRSQNSSSSTNQRQPDPEGRLSPHRQSHPASPPTRQANSTHNSNNPSLPNPPPPQSIDAWNSLALQHVHNGEYDMALAAFQHVLRAYKQQYGHVHPLVASAYHNLGTVHAKRAQLLLDDTLHQRHCRAQSLQCFQSAARAARDSLGRDHPNVAVSLVRIGFLLLQARQYNNAVITFQEALRIRQSHYGPHHALVANLYNNLGVCYMHLGQFAHGRDLLHHALTIQRTLLQQAQQEAEAAEEKKDSSVVPQQCTSQALELADTLFNIGGLALEWIRRQGPDVRHAQDAEAAFEEALELRKSVLGPKDPMVLQVKSLLDMARSIPRPKSPGRKSSAKPTKGNGNVNFHPDESLKPPDPVGISPDTRRTADLPNLSPPRTTSHHQQDDDKDNINSPSLPYQHYISRQYGKSETDTASPPRQSPSRPPKPTLQQQQQSSPNRFKADYLEPPRVTRRSLLDQTDTDVGPPEKPRHALSPTQNSQVGRMSIASSSASTVKVGSPARQVQSSPPERDQSVFRPETSKKEKPNVKLPPPMMEIAVSQDEEDDGLYDPATLPRPAHTNIFISPHYVPHLSPHKVNHRDDATRSVASSSYSGVAGSSMMGSSAIVKTYSYDPEEQLVLTDGLGSDGNPLPDDYDAMPCTTKDSSSSTRKIMVVRPYRSTPDDSITSPTSVLSSRTPWELSTTEDNNAGGNNTTASLYSSELNYSSKTTSYGRDAPTNPRNDTLNRARALLQAHNPDYLDSPQVQLSGQPSYMKNSPDRVKQQLFKPGKDGERADLDEDLEDGLAPLGANDSLVVKSSPPTKKSFHRDMLTNNPDEHLREIYEEASRCLKNHYYDEAQEYFGVILQSQRHLHGPFHHDVAAALHNCGLAQLRAGNHHQALKSFEEAVRIRKGTLGKEHPHVAASLVKCGITFLLLHRFEEALWSFREALSIRKHSLGTLHPSTARIYNNIGCVHIEFNELREARRAFEGALDIQRNALCHDPESGPVRFGLAATLCNLGYLYRYRDMHERAAQVLREAADIQEEILGGTHPTVLSTLDSLAEALANSGKASEAYVTQETILDRFHSTEPPGSRRLVRAEAGLRYKMSKSAKQMKDQERQIKNLQQALQAVRSLEENNDSLRSQAGLEKSILMDLREARGTYEANELNWI